MQTDSVEKAAGIGAIGLWAALHGWLGWLVVLYAVCMMLDWVTGTILAIKNGVWSSHKARQGLWHKGGSIIMIFVSVLTDILLGLTLNHISGLTLPFRACLKSFDKRGGKADNKGKQGGDDGECVNIQAISAGKSMKRYERI